MHSAVIVASWRPSTANNKVWLGLSVCTLVFIHPSTFLPISTYSNDCHRFVSLCCCFHVLDFQYYYIYHFNTTLLFIYYLYDVPVLFVMANFVASAGKRRLSPIHIVLCNCVLVYSMLLLFYHLYSSLIFNPPLFLYSTPILLHADSFCVMFPRSGYDE